MAKGIRYTYDEVKKYFNDNGCDLLSEQYINSNQKLIYLCVCGNKSEIKFRKFKEGQRCRECTLKTRRLSKEAS